MKLKLLYLLTLSFLILSIFTACSDYGESEKSGILEPPDSLISDSDNDSKSSDISTENSDYHGKNEKVNYGMHLSVCGSLPTEYNGEAIEVNTCVKNNSDTFEYTFFVFVNGIKTDYVLKSGEEIISDNIAKVESQSENYQTIIFEPAGLKKGEKAIVSIDFMFDPRYTLDSTENMSFSSHHTITGLLPFEITATESSHKAKPEISEKNSKIAITDEFRSEFDTISPDNTSVKTNILDDSVLFRLFKNEPIEDYMTADNELKATAQAFGKEGKYIVSVYINHKLQKAFDGCEYAFCNVENGYITEIPITIDTSKLQGINHIYMMAVPYDNTEIDKRLITQKTETKLLLKSENEKQENENTSSTEIPKNEDTSSTEISENEENSDNNTDSKISQEQNSSENSTVYSDESKNDDSNSSLDESKVIVKDDATTITTDSILSLICVKDNKAVAYSFGEIEIIDLKSGAIINKLQFAPTDSFGVINEYFVIYGINGAYIKLYDFDGNLCKTLYPEAKDCGEYCISDDATEIAYTYTDESGENTFLYVDSTEFNNKRLVKAFKVSKNINDIVGVSKILSFSDGVIYLNLINVREASPKIKYGNEIAYIDKNGEIKQIYSLSEYEQLTAASSKTVQTDCFVIVEESGTEQSLAQKGSVKICGFGQEKLTVFNCEEAGDNQFAYVSKGLKLIALKNINVNGGENVIKVYNLYTKEKLLEVKFQASCDVKFSDDEKTIYIASENGINIYETGGFNV